MYASFTSGKQFIQKNTITCEILYDKKVVIKECILELEYSIDKPSEMDGKIIIDNNDYDLLEEFDDNKKVEIRSVGKDIDIHFYSNNLIIDYAAGHNLESSVSNAFFGVHFYEIKKSFTTASNAFFLERFIKPFSYIVSSNKRLIRFLITGPYKLWNEVLFEGDYKLFYDNYIIQVFPGNINEREFGTNEDMTISKRRYYIELTEIENKNTSIDSFINSAIEFIDNFLTLSSFLSDHSITWWSYTFIQDKDIIDFTKKINSTNLNFKDYNSLLFNSKFCKDILQDKLQAFIKTNVDYIDMKNPILEFLSKNGVEYLPQRFTIVYIALETLCNNFAKKENIKDILRSEKTLTNMKKTLKDIIDTLDITDTEKVNIIQKLPELNRTPMKILYETFFNKFNLQLNDKHYTEDKSNIVFLRIRNKLLHGDGKKVKNKDLHNAVKDIEFFFINIILKILEVEQLYKKNYFHF